MPIFVWSGVDRQGSKQKGEIEADNPMIARQLLSRQGVVVRTLKTKPKDLLESIPLLQQKVKSRDLVIFTRQFATLIDAGVPLVQCLDILQQQEANKTFKRIISQIKADVESGKTFSEALKRHPNVFDTLYVNLVAAGEMGGMLDVTLNRLAAYMEKMDRLRKKVKGAMTYPAVVMGIAVLVVAVILTYVIPVFAGLFREAGAKLPPMTLLVIAASDFFQKYIHWIILGLILLVYLFKRFRKTERGRDLTDRIALRAPVFGILLRKVAIARFSRTLGTMLGAGVPILDSLDIVATTAGNSVVERALRKARSSIAEGQTVAEPLAKSGVFPPMVVQMISVGEATGALDEMLSKIADFYDEEVDIAVDALTSLLEPLMIVFLGVTIGGLLVAMYLPIFQLADVVSRAQ
ncbi:MAG TPA: pilus assembly protein PilC [Syntrophobacteraceae bacterium]|nr:pilus assembly protein PilC [Syntrophobacteraceae bacterium]